MPTLTDNRNGTGTSAMEYALTPEGLRQTILAVLSPDQPLCIWGQPGTGKSEIIAQVSDALFAVDHGYSLDDNGRLHDPHGQFTTHRPWLHDVRGATLDPVDLRGVPTIGADGLTHWAAPAFLHWPNGRGILFLDELNRAGESVLNGMLELTRDRRIGDARLPDGVSVIAACNYEGDGGGISRLPSALANRFTHYDTTTDVSDWRAWAINNEVDPMVIAFVSNHPRLLYKFDPKERAYPTYRSWVFVSNIIKRNMPARIELASIRGAVGHEATIEFESFMLVYRNCPSLDSILLNPATADIPAHVIEQWAVAFGLAERANDKNMSQVITYLNRMPKEFAALAMQRISARPGGVSKNIDFIKWATGPTGKLLGL